MFTHAYVNGYVLIRVRRAIRFVILHIVRAIVHRAVNMVVIATRPRYDYTRAVVPLPRRVFPSVRGFQVIP